MAEKKKGGVALRIRPPAFGLPTGCPKCLPSYFYLRLGNTAFRPEYSMYMPDSEDLPIAEFGLLAGFSSEPGGVEDFLRKEKLCDLDNGLTDLERSDLRALKSLVQVLNDALTLELWSKNNEAIVDQIYMSQLPWPINRAIEWNMRWKIMTRLGINKDNAKDREGEIYKAAFDAYEALSAKKQTETFFLRDKPTSLDALLLAHLIFVNLVPLEASLLKEELNMRHPQLVQYAEMLKADLLKSGTTFPSSVVPGESPKSPRGPSSPRPSYASSSKSGGKAEPKRKPTAKEREFRRKGKLFLLTQLAAVVGYILFSGLQQYDEDDEDEDEHD